MASNKSHAGTKSSSSGRKGRGRSSTSAPAAKASSKAAGRGTGERSQLAGQLRSARKSRDKEKLRDLGDARNAARTAAAAGVKPRPSSAKAILAAHSSLKGKDNHVQLRQLRAAVPHVGRAEFDKSLRALRLSGRLSLDSHEGLIKKLSRAERRAGIPEAGSHLVHVSSTGTKRRRGNRGRKR